MLCTVQNLFLFVCPNKYVLLVRIMCYLLREDGIIKVIIKYYKGDYDTMRNYFN